MCFVKSPCPFLNLDYTVNQCRPFLLDLMWSITSPPFLTERFPYHVRPSPIKLGVFRQSVFNGFRLTSLSFNTLIALSPDQQSLEVSLLRFIRHLGIIVQCRIHYL